MSRANPPQRCESSDLRRAMELGAAAVCEHMRLPELCGDMSQPCKACQDLSRRVILAALPALYRDK